MDYDTLTIFERIATALETIAADITEQRRITTLRTRKLLAEYQSLRDRMCDAMRPYNVEDAALSTKSDRYWEHADRRIDQTQQAAAAFEHDNPDIVALWEAQQPDPAALDPAAD